MSTDRPDVAAVLHDYEVGREVGRGAYGIVWSARHRQLGREVAVKQLAGSVTATDESSSRFRREARILAQMDHPHVVTVFDYREHEQLRLIVMELLTGGTFADRRAADLSVETAIVSTLAAASGLHHVHEQGILHRDVKPENLMFDRRGTLKVTDFGIARIDVVDTTVIHLSHAGQFFGTPAYVSPEQAGHTLGESRVPIGAASDQYSLAAVLYETLSGQLTHDATGGAVALCTRRMNERARPLRTVAPDVPRAIEAVVMKALARDPNVRYATVEDFAVALAHAATDTLGADWLARSQVLLRDTGAIVDAARAPRRIASTQPATGMPPTGTVTFLFTGAGGTGRLRKADPNAMQASMARHDTVVREAVEPVNGYVFKAADDAFGVAFADPVAAVEAAVAIQRAIAGAVGSEPTPVRLRLAMHTGTVDERGGAYVGRAVNRGAQLATIANAGQTLMSGTTAAMLGDRLPADVDLVDLGRHRLKDLDQPEPVWQVAIAGLPNDFPALRSLSNPRLQTNIPMQTSSFLGRDRELTDVTDLLTDARLVTIVGPGGAGKTRLALHAAVELLDGSGDGVWLVELAPVADADRVVPTVSRVLGLTDDPTRDPLEYLIDVCLDRNTLIILDNCEHTIDAAAKLANELVQRCPDVCVLATSREPLKIRGEHVYRIPGLTVPDVEASTSAIASAAAVELFAERATQHDRTFSLDDANAPVVATICRRLDGIPLAIELAAARLGSLSLEQLNARLDERFRILTGGPRTDEPRQQTLLALVDWSWELLDATERDVLARASVFNGSFDLDAAERLLPDDRDEPWKLLDRLSGLVDKSLVQLTDTGRYRLLETIRAFAATKLDATGGAAGVADAHLAYYLGLALDAEPHLRRHDQLRYWARLDPEHDNVIAALEHALTKTDSTEALQLIVSLRNYWSRHGLHTLASDALDTALDHAGSLADPHLRCRGEIDRAWHYGRQGRFRSGNEHAEHAIGAARALDDHTLLALALVTTTYDVVGEPEKSLAYGAESLALATQLRDGYLISCALQRRAGGLRESDSAEALRCIEQSLELDIAAGDQDGVLVGLFNLAMVDLDAGQPASARSRSERALAILSSFPNPSMEAGFLEILGYVEQLEHNNSEAHAYFARAFVLARRTGDQIIMVESLLGCAMTETVPPDSAMLHGAADALLDHLGSQFAPTDARAREVDHDRLRAQLGEDVFAENYARGRAMNRSQIMAVALRDALGVGEEGG